MTNDGTTVNCDEHGSTLTVNGCCVLCADDRRDTLPPAFELALGIEHASRGNVASVDDIVHAIRDDE